MRVTCLLVIVVAMALGANAQELSMIALPAPTGPLSIGTTSWVVSDSTRQEAFAPGQPRQVRVVAWYPARAGATGARALYLREGPAEVQTLASLMRAPSAFDSLLTLRAHGVVDAPPAGGPRLPVLVFSHGYTGIPSSYTVLLEDLASHGYAVLSVVHPYEATAATLAAGSVVTFVDEKGAIRQGIRDVLAECPKTTPWPR